MKISKAVILLIVLFLSKYTFAQKRYETNQERKRCFNWLFGDSVWLDFKTNPPIVKSGSKMVAIESATAFSDTSGKLLLYSDGLNIWNGNHNIIRNGSSLNGHSSSSQGSLFVKHPIYDSLVYLFTNDAQGGVNGFQVSTISINSNLDSSIVIEKNKLLINNTCESIAATQHQNGIYTWVTVHSKIGNSFYSYLINETGIVNCPIISNEGLNYDGNIFNCQTTSAFSYDGKYFAINQFKNDKIEIFYFDKVIGKFNTLSQLNNIYIPTGINFSSNNKYLYIIERSKQINQFNLETSQNSIVKSINNKYFIIQIEKTPYNEIYVNVLDSLYIGRIKFPDSSGIGANFELRSLYLNGKKGKNGLCNFNRSYNYTPSIDYKYHLNCIKNTIDFNGLDTFSANSHVWQINKLNKTLEATYTIKNISHTFLDTGLYVVRYIAQNGSRKDTVVKMINLYPKINQYFLGNDTTYVKGDVINKTLRVPNGMHCQMWQDSSGLSTFTANKKGVYFCKVITQSFCEVIDTIEIKECINSTSPVIFKKQGDSLFCSHQFADTFIWYRNNQVYKTSIGNANHESSIKISDTGNYRVEAIKYGYCKTISSSFTVNKLGLNSLHLADYGVQFYPNPSQGQISIVNNNNTPIECSIYDIQGKKITTQALNEGASTLELNLSKGIYILSFTIKTTTIHQKLILQ